MEGVGVFVRRPSLMKEKQRAREITMSLVEMLVCRRTEEAREGDSRALRASMPWRMDHTKGQYSQDLLRTRYAAR